MKGEKDMGMLEWAKKEIEIAKKERKRTSQKECSTTAHCAMQAHSERLKAWRNTVTLV